MITPALEHFPNAGLKSQHQYVHNLLQLNDDLVAAQGVCESSKPTRANIVEGEPAKHRMNERISHSIEMTVKTATNHLTVNT